MFLNPAILLVKPKKINLTTKHHGLLGRNQICHARNRPQDLYQSL